MQSLHGGSVSLASRYEKPGLIYRKRGTVDKRDVEIHFTPSGDKLVKAIASLQRNELSGLTG